MLYKQSQVLKYIVIYNIGKCNFIISLFYPKVIDRLSTNLPVKQNKNKR